MNTSTPADQAGVEPGDVITAINGDAVRTVSDLQARLAQLEPGGTARIQAIRAGTAVTMDVQLGTVRSGVGRDGR